MKVIIGKKQSGKTTQLIRMSAKTGDYIVTKDNITAIYTSELARKIGADIPYPLTFHEFLTHAWKGGNVKGFLIDDADQFLDMMLSNAGARMHGMTVTIEETKSD